MTTIFREVKLCVIGESGVGKSSIIHRLIHNSFEPYPESTIGSAFATKSIQFESTTFKYHIWDTAGQEKFRSLTPMYYRGASAAIIVYDITSKASFDAIQLWLKDLKQYAELDIVVAIAGNKCDLEEKRKVQFKDALEFATSQNALFVETSAKTAINVATLFTEISEYLEKRAPTKEMPRQLDVGPTSSDVVIIPRSSSRRKTCCSRHPIIL